MLLVATGGQVYATLQLPALMADIINNGIVPGDMGRIWQDGGWMLLLVLVSAAASFASSYLSARVGAYFSRDLRTAIFAKVLQFNMVDMKKYSTASLITRTTNDVNQVQMIITLILTMMLRAPLFCILGLVMAIQTAPEMSWIIVVGITGVVVSSAVILSIVGPKFKIFQGLIDRVTLITRENLTGLRVIRAFNNDELERKKFGKTLAILNKV